VYRGAIVTHASKGDGLKTTTSRVGSDDPDGPLVTKSSIDIRGGPVN